MNFWPCGAFWQFLRSLKTCAGETNARHSSMHVSNHRYQWTPRNCLKKLVAAILMQIMTKKAKNDPFSLKKMRLKTTFLSFWECVNSIFHARQFFINSGHILDIFRAKKLIDFSPPFNPYFTVRPTSESYNGSLKVLPEGSMVEYLPVGSHEAHQTNIGKKKISAPNS